MGYPKTGRGAPVAAMNEPTPWTCSRALAGSSSVCACRTMIRLAPPRLSISRSVGRRSPGAYFPRRISPYTRLRNDSVLERFFKAWHFHVVLLNITTAPPKTTLKAMWGSAPSPAQGTPSLENPDTFSRMATPFWKNVSGIPKGQVPLAGAWGRRPHMVFGTRVQALAPLAMAKPPGLAIVEKVWIHGIKVWIEVTLCRRLSRNAGR